MMRTGISSPLIAQFITSHTTVTSQGTKFEYSADQDSTDFEKCMDCLLRYEHDHCSGREYENVAVLGGLGGDLSHQLANINVLHKYSNRKVRIVLLRQPIMLSRLH